jgi:hypothetical protein
MTLNNETEEAKPDQNTAYSKLSKQISHEENLINNRLMWMLTFQGFLFASIALLGDNQIDSALRILLQCLIPAIGTIIAILTLLGVIGAYISIDNQRRDWNPYLMHGPQPGGKKSAKWLGRIASGGTPLIMIVAWVYIYFKLN